MQGESEPIGPGQLNWLVSVVEDGTATRDEARELLEEFVRQADTRKLSPRIIQHMRDCVAAYLAGRKILLPAASEGRDTPLTIPVDAISMRRIPEILDTNKRERVGVGAIALVLDLQPSLACRPAR